MNLVKHANPIALGRNAVGLGGVVVKGAAQAVGLTKGVVHFVSSAAGAARTAPETVEQGTEHDLAHEERSSGPNVVPMEPQVPEEPPVDVVGMALAADAAAEREGVPGDAGVAHEPRAASRDEEHGAAFERATVDEIVEESAAALEGDLEPEPHLTEPLLDPADAKAVLAETATLRKAAETDKG